MPPNKISEAEFIRIIEDFNFETVDKIVDLQNKVNVLEKQNEQLTLLCTALMDTLFIKKTITPTEVEQTISKIVSKGKDNTTVH